MEHAADSQVGRYDCSLFFAARFNDFFLRACSISAGNLPKVAVGDQFRQDADGGIEHALKLSVAFGGHMAAAMLRRWTAADSSTGWAERQAA